MPLLISDANILIDMECGGLLHRMFELGHHFAVLDVLYEEELKDQHPELPGHGLQIVELSADGVTLGEQLIRDHGDRGASRNDLLSLALARQQNCPLLTGDRRLREICDAVGHAVNGMLWLIKEMHDAGLLTREEVVEAYQAMKQQRRRLPWPRVQAQLREMPED